MAHPTICSARTCTNRIGPSDRCFPFPSGSRGITWQELLLGTVNRSTGTLIVCSSHFSEQQYVRAKNGQLHLCKHALPDLNVIANGNECRFCLEPSKSNMYPLFTQHADVPSLADIERTVNIRIRPHDGLPQLACATCMSKIRYIKRIQDQFQESDRRLRVRLGVPMDQPELDEEPAMEEEYLVEQHPAKPDADQDNILLTADQLTIIEGAQEEIETSETANESPEVPEEPPECAVLFSGDIQESTENNGEYDMTELAEGADSDDAAANGNDSDETDQKNGNPYKPFRYSKRARRGD